MQKIMKAQQSNKIIFLLQALFLLLAAFFTFSCLSTSSLEEVGNSAENAVASESEGLLLESGTNPSKSKNHISRNLSDRGIKSAKKLYKFFMANNPAADKKQVKRLAKYYVREARDEGINSDCAFVQMCLETGFLNFGGLVTADMHNYCGLGAMDSEHRGEVFESELLGVRAHIQHLHAYACDRPLKKECIDSRYKYVKPRGKAPTIAGLTKNWAMDPLYGEKLDRLLSQLENF